MAVRSSASAHRPQIRSAVLNSTFWCASKRAAKPASRSAASSAAMRSGPVAVWFTSR